MQRISDPTQQTGLELMVGTILRAAAAAAPCGTCAADEQILMRSEIYFKVR